MEKETAQKRMYELAEQLFALSEIKKQINSLETDIMKERFEIVKEHGDLDLLRKPKG